MLLSLSGSLLFRCRLYLKGIIISCIFILLTGCSTLGVYNPATGKKEFVAISTSEEVSLGGNFHGGIVEKEGLSQDRSKVSRVERIGEQIAKVSDRQDYEYSFYVIDKDELNAFTSLGGNIYIYSGLVDRLETDGRIAAVLAHEVGHCAARHVAKKFQSSVGFSLVQSLALIYLGVEDGTKEMVSMSSSAVMGLVFSSYSRKDEYAADRLAVKYVGKAGYDHNVVAEALEILAVESKDAKGMLWLRSHPYLDDRVVAVRKEIEAIENVSVGQ